MDGDVGGAPDGAQMANEDMEYPDENLSHTPSYDDMTDDEEEEECRVCRGPAEQDHPLFAPCKCSGSIGLCHQDCLVSWLEVTRGGRCELCKYKFRFAPKYADGAPDRLPPREVLLGLARRAAIRWMPLGLRAALVVFLWMFLLPLTTAYLYQGWMHRPSSVASRWSWDLVPGDAVSGAVVAAVIVVSFLSLMSFADFLRFHWQQVEDGVDVDGAVGQGVDGMGGAVDRQGLGPGGDGGEDDLDAVPEEEEGIDNGFLEHDDERETLEIGNDRRAARGWGGAIDLGDHPDDRRHAQPPRLDRNALGVMDQGELFFPARREEGQVADDDANRERPPRQRYPALAERNWEDEIGDQDEPDQIYNELLANRDGGRRELLAAAALRRQRQRDLLQQRVMGDMQLVDEDGQQHHGGWDDGGVPDTPQLPLHDAAMPVDEIDEPINAHEELRQQHQQDNDLLPQGPFEEDDDDRLEHMMRAQEAHEDEDERWQGDENDVNNNEFGGEGRNNELQPLPQQAGNNDMFEPQFEPLDPVFDQEEPADVEIHLALDELLGLRGPLGALVRNLLWLLAFNTTFLGLFAFIPHTIGSSVFSSVSNSTAINSGAGFFWGHVPYLHFLDLSSGGNATGFSLLGVIQELNDESQRVNALLRMPEVATISLGYFSMALMVLCWQGGLAFYKRWYDKGPEAGMVDITGAMNAEGGVGDGVDEADEFAVDDFDGAGDRALLGGGLLDDGEDMLGDEFDPMDDGEWDDEELDPAAHPPADIRVALGEKLALGLKCAAAIVKVGILLFLKMLLLPLLLGISLDVATLSLFDSTLNERIRYAGADLFGSVLLHWVIGITFMLLVTVSVLQLREVVHPELLARVVRPQEPQPDLLGNLLQEDGATHIKRMLLSLGIYAALLAVHVWLPSQLVVFLGISHHLPFFRPKLWHGFLTQLQVPIELLVFHLSMLAFLEKYKNHIGGMQHIWLVKMCQFMGLTSHVLPRDVDEFELVGWKHVFLGDDRKSEVALPDDAAPPLNLDEDAGTDATSASSAEDDVGKAVAMEDGPVHHKMHSEKHQTTKSAELDPFWSKLISMKDSDGATDELILLNMQFPADQGRKPMHQSFSTKPDGRRVLDSTVSYIRLPRSENAKHVEIADAGSNATATSSSGFLLPTVIGAYRLRRRAQKTATDEPVIEFWREVAGKPIVRPPEGWDDLGVGGAEVQGRWAWDKEQKSEIENGVARRTDFFPRSDDNKYEWRRLEWWKTVLPLMTKMAILLVLSWLAVLVVACVVLSAPLAVGRFVFFLLRIPDRFYHDPMAFAIGGAALFPILYKLSDNPRNEEIDEPQSLSARWWAWVTSFHLPPNGSGKLKCVIEALFAWLIVFPFLIGTTYDLLLVKSLSFWAGKETLVEGSSLALSWGVGMLLLNLWAALCYLGAFSREFWSGMGIGNAGVPGMAAGAAAIENANNQALEGAEAQMAQESPATGDVSRNLKWQGDGGRIRSFAEIMLSVLTKWEWDKVDRVALSEECVWPILQQLFATTVAPIMISLCCSIILWMPRGRQAADIVVPFLGLIDKGRCHKSIFCLLSITSIMIRLALAFQTPLQHWFQAAHKAARDDRYLVGETLLNYVPQCKIIEGGERHSGIGQDRPG